MSAAVAGLSAGLAGHRNHDLAIADVFVIVDVPDAGRLLFLDFMLIHGAGWYIVPFDLPIVTPCAKHQKQRLQRHQTRHHDNADPDPAERSLGGRLARLTVQVRNQAAHQALMLDAGQGAR